LFLNCSKSNSTIFAVNLFNISSSYHLVVSFLEIIFICSGICFILSSGENSIIAMFWPPTCFCSRFLCTIITTNDSSGFFLIATLLHVSKVPISIILIKWWWRHVFLWTVISNNSTPDVPDFFVPVSISSKSCDSHSSVVDDDKEILNSSSFTTWGNRFVSAKSIFSYIIFMERILFPWFDQSSPILNYLHWTKFNGYKNILSPSISNENWDCFSILFAVVPQFILSLHLSICYCIQMYPLFATENPLFMSILGNISFLFAMIFKFNTKNKFNSSWNNIYFFEFILFWKHNYV